MLGKAPLISCILPRPRGSKTSPPNSGLKEAERALDLVVGVGAKAVVVARREARMADFMVAFVLVS